MKIEKEEDGFLESVKEFLLKEFGENYKDVIESDFCISMEEFKEMFMVWDGVNREWHVNI